jgi:hypothetical protein
MYLYSLNITLQQCVEAEFSGEWAKHNIQAEKQDEIKVAEEGKERKFLAGVSY